MQIDWNHLWPMPDTVSVDSKIWLFYWEKRKGFFEYIPPRQVEIVAYRDDFDVYGCVVAENSYGARFNITGFNNTQRHTAHDSFNWYGFNYEGECKALYNKFVEQSRLEYQRDINFCQGMLDKLQPV